MNRARINALFEQAHVVHETPYESSVVDPTVVSIHKQRVFDRDLFAELIVRQCIGMVLPYNEEDPCAERLYELADTIGEHFGVEE